MTTRAPSLSSHDSRKVIFPPEFGFSYVSPVVSAMAYPYARQAMRMTGRRVPNPRRTGCTLTPAPVAQWTERLPSKQRVGGSIPPGGVAGQGFNPLID